MKQDGEGWLAWRRAGIGGSDASVILGLSPWRTRYDLWLEKTGQSEAVEENAAMRRGKALEPEARAAYEDYTKLIVEPTTMEHRDWPTMRASLDGLTFDGVLCLELKCPGTARHLDVLHSLRVPELYMPQCQHLLAVSGAERLHFWSYHPEHPPALILVERDDAYIAWLIEQERGFWEQVDGTAPPPMPPDLPYRLDTDWLETARLYRQADAGMSEWEGKKAAAKERLVALAKASGVYKTQGGGVTLTRFEKLTTNYAQAAKDAGLALEQYQTPREEWRATIAKEKS